MRRAGMRRAEGRGAVLAECTPPRKTQGALRAASGTLTIFQTCTMLSSATDATIHGSCGLQQKSETLDVCPPC